MSCLLCGSAESEIISEKDRHGQPLTTRVCQGCGLVCNDPIPDDETLSQFYAENYRVAYKGAAEPRKRQVLRNFRRIRDHISRFQDIIDPANNVLDVGAGSGEFLFSMKNAGKNAVGLEPNREYAEYCRQILGLEVETAEITADLFGDQHFDLIRLNHVLEHMNDPVGKLAMISELLSDKGVLYVEVPNIEIYAKTKSRGNMFHFGHIFNFNPWTLRAAAKLAGLNEDLRSQQRCHATTGLFLVKGPARDTMAAAANADNVHQVMKAIKSHYQDSATAARITKLRTKLVKRVEETITSRRYNTMQDIGKAVLNG